MNLILLAKLMSVRSFPSWNLFYRDGDGSIKYSRSRSPDLQTILPWLRKLMPPISLLNIKWFNHQSFTWGMESIIKKLVHLSHCGFIGNISIIHLHLQHHQLESKRSFKINIIIQRFSLLFPVNIQNLIVTYTRWVCCLGPWLVVLCPSSAIPRTGLSSIVYGCWCKNIGVRTHD